MKHVFLHIGMPKTGSTAIQKFLHENSASLEKQGAGYYLPKEIMSYAAHHNGEVALFYALEKSGHAGLAEAKNPVSDEMERFKRYASNYDVLIVSDEDIYGQWSYGDPGTDPDAFWREIRNFFCCCLGEDVEIDIILYLRRQDLWAESHWKMITGRSGNQKRSALEYALWKYRYHVLDYNDFSLRLDRCFGRDHVKIRIYDKGVFYGGDIRKDFIHACGLRWDDRFVLHDEDINNSITAECAWAVLHINSHMNPMIGQSWINMAVRAFASAHPEEGRVHPLKDEDRRDLLLRCEEQNRSVARRYFEREELFPEDDRPWTVCLEDPIRDRIIAKTILRTAHRMRLRKWLFHPLRSAGDLFKKLGEHGISIGGDGGGWLR